MPEPSLEAGTPLTGRRGAYEILEVMHVGRAGRVYRASRVEDGGLVAIKVFQLDRPSDARELEQELHALRELGAAPNLPSLLDWSLDPTQDGPGFAVLEYFPRGSLADQLAAGTPLAPAELMRLFEDLLSGLEALHTRNGPLLHLDLKPANVLVGEGRYVLSDFGLSRPVGARAGILPPSYGTPGYRAPEQARAHPELFGVRTDLYGLGATMWSACCGRLLDARDEPTDWSPLYGLPPLHLVAPEVDEGLARVVMELLRARPALRPGTAREVRDRLHTRGAKDALLESRLADGRRALRDALTDLTHPLLRHVLNVTPNLRVARYVEGDALCRVGDPSSHAFLLIRGLLEVERDGRRLALLESPGEIVGEIAALTGARRTASLIAREETVVAVFDGGELLDFLRLNPELAIQHVAALSERLARESTLG